MRKLLCKPKDRVFTEDKSNEIDFSNCEAVYFGESKRSLKSRSDEYKKSVRNCDFEKNEIAKHCWEPDRNFGWDQKKHVDRESRLIPRKLKQYILLRILITIKKCPICSPKCGFLIYGIS